MKIRSKNEKKSIEGVEELQSVDMVINVLMRELNSLPVTIAGQNETKTEWVSLLPWPITSQPIEETLLWYGIGLAGKVFAMGTRLM